MASSSSPSAGLGGGGLSNLASSLRSASMANTAAVSSQSSYSAYNNTSNPNYTNNNTTNHNNNTEVPDSSHYHDAYGYEDDSTEEDEEYSAYIKEQQHQQQQQQQQQQHLALSRQDSSDMSQDEDHHHHRHRQQPLSIQQLIHQELGHDMDDDSGAHHAQDQLVPAMMELDHQADDDDDLDEEEEDEDDDESETISLTEDDIDFDLVYALHTFVATQEGQASVVRNDPLMLLEDTNVYWWLVRVLKTGVIGYIPAENIETPFERLARLNKYRNVGLSAPQALWDDINNRPNIEPRSSTDKPANRKSVIFTAQNEFFGASDTEWDDEEYDEDGEWYGEEGEEDDDEEMDEEDDEAADHTGDEDVSQDHLDQEARQLAMSMGDDHNTATTEKSELQLEAERMEREIMEEQRQREALEAQAHAQTQAAQHQIGNMDVDQRALTNGANDDDETEDDSDDNVNITNRYRKPLLDEDDFILDAEPKIISLTPAIARDDIPIGRAHTSPGKAKKLRISSESTRQQSNDRLSMDSEEERELQRQRMEERRSAKMQALFGNSGASSEPPRKTKEEYEAGLPPEVVVKKPGKFKSLFGVGKSSKDKEKEKERKERERQEKEKNKSKSAIASASAGLFRSRSNSNGSIGSNSSGGPKSPPPTAHSPETSTSPPPQEIITLRVYPGNVDFGASMYKTVIVNAQTLASEVANQAVVKFRLAPDGVASTADFYLTVKGVDGDETVLQPNDKPMAIYQSLTSHLTTPLPKDHRLSISSVSSMMSVNSVSSFASNMPLSPNTVRRIGSGKSADPAQRSIRFFLNKKIRRSGSVTSGPSTPTTPTTEDFVWVKVVCLDQDLPASMVILEGMGTATPREALQDKDLDPASLATKIEQWLPMQVISNVGDVIYKALEKMGLRMGVVDGVAEHLLQARRRSVPDGLLIHYQLGLQLMALTPGLTAARKMGDEISLRPELPLHKCLEDHRLTPIRRSPKADVASMPIAPDYVFYLHKSAKSIQAEEKLREQKQATKKVPEPLQAQSLHAAMHSAPHEPIHASPTSPRANRSMSGDIGSRATSPGSPLSPQHGRTMLQTAFHGQSPRGPASPSSTLPPGVRIPRRTDSVILSPTSPIKSTFVDGSGRPSPTPSIQSLQQQQQQQHFVTGSRTPTPDQLAMRQRARSPSVGQSQAPSSSSIRSQQVPSPAPSNLSNQGGAIAGDQEDVRSLTPERSNRLERNQRVISPTHGPSPLSLSSVTQEGERSASRESNHGKSPSWHRDSSLSMQDEINNNTSRPTSSTGSAFAASKVAPLNIKKNSTQGVDIVLNKGVIRSSRLINSKQYRYSFIPTEGGDEIDISEIIEDILGEDDEGLDEDDDELQMLPVAADGDSPGTSTHEPMSHKDRAAAAVARASQTVAASMARRRASATSQTHPQRTLSNSSRVSRTSTQDRDMLEHLGTSVRGSDTLLKLERVLKSVDGVTEEPMTKSASTPLSQHQSEFKDSDEHLQILEVANSPSQPSVRTIHSNTSSPTPGGGPGSRTASPVSARSVDSQYASKGWPSSTGPFAHSPIARGGSPSQHLKKRDSDVEIQVASVATLGARSASPMSMMRPGPGSGANSPQSLRPGSPYGMSRPTLLSSPASATKSPSPLGGSSAAGLEAAASADGPASSSRSFSPIPRRLQHDSGASSPALSTATTGGPLSVQTSSLLPSLGPSSAGSTGSPGSLRSGMSNAMQARSRSASASVAETNSGARMPGSGTSVKDMTKEQWLLSSDYNAGMQDLLTLVRGGRSSSVSHVNSTSTGFGSLSRATAGGAYIGPDGKLVQLPSAFKASLLSHSKTAKKLKELKSLTASRHDTQGETGNDVDGDPQQQQRNDPSNDQHHGPDNDDSQADNRGKSHDDDDDNDDKEITKKDNKKDALLEDDSSEDDESSFKMRMLEYMTRELSLKDVAPDCHPEVLACWKEVDATLDRVEGELDALLAKVKTTVF